MMDGHSRGKLAKAGYTIFRQRDFHPVSQESTRPQEPFEIREYSSRGEWVLYGRYPTKAARERAWTELMKDDKHIGEGHETE